jgi:hypothetical protein
LETWLKKQTRDYVRYIHGGGYDCQKPAKYGFNPTYASISWETVK